MSVSGGHLFAADDHQAFGVAFGPRPIRRVRVVVGRHDEIEPGRARDGRQFSGPVSAVGMDGVQMQITPVPAHCAAGPGDRVGLRTLRARDATGQRDVGSPRHAQRVEHDGPERQHPAAGFDGAGHIPGCRMGGRQAESAARTTGPAAETGAVPELVAGGAEDAEVEHVVDDGAEGEAAVDRADIDTPHPFRHVERHIRPLVDAESEPAAVRQCDRRVRRLDADLCLHAHIVHGAGPAVGYIDTNGGRTAAVGSALPTLFTWPCRTVRVDRVARRR